MIHKRSQASRKGGGRGETASQISHRRRRGKKDGTAARYVMYPDPGTGRDELQKPPNPSYPINEVAPTPVTRRAFAGTLTPSPPLLPSSAPSVNGKRKPLRISKASAEDGAQRPLRHLLCPSPSSPHPPFPKHPTFPALARPHPKRLRGGPRSGPPRPPSRRVFTRAIQYDCQTCLVISPKKKMSQYRCGVHNERNAKPELSR